MQFSLIYVLLNLNELNLKGKKVKVAHLI